MDLHPLLAELAPDGRYLWYTVEIHSEPPPAERKLAVSAPLRKVVAVEIPISNPTDIELEFAVMITGEGLLGDEPLPERTQGLELTAVLDQNGAYLPPGPE